MKEYDAYLFDADGTLMDSRELIYRSFADMAERLGAKAPERSLVYSTIGLPMPAQIRVLLGDGRDDAFYDQAALFYGEGMMRWYRDHLRLFPGVKEGLAALQSAGKRLACVTSRRLFSLEAFFNYLDLDRYFDLVVTPENTSGHKPGPEPALFAAERLGIRPERCVFIGDATFDIQCGHAAGMDTVLVEWGGLDPTGWEVQPDYIVGRFAELLPEGRG